MKIFKNLFRNKTKEEKIWEHFHYLGLFVACGKITGKEAKEEHCDFKRSLEDEIKR